MRIEFLLLVGVLIILGNKPVMGQVEGDTLGLTGTMADTVVAKMLLNEAIELNKQGKYKEAFVSADSARIIFEVASGEETREVADALHQMGRSKYFSGAYDESIIIYERSLLIRKQVFGLEHPDVGKSYNNLGIAYDSKREYDKAIIYKKLRIEILLKNLGPEHPEVAFSYIYLGSSYDSKGEYNEAINLYQKYLEILLKTVEPEDPILADIYYNLGISHSSKGEYQKAIYWNQKALNIRLKALGFGHPAVAKSFNNQGGFYLLNNQYDKAIGCFHKALESRLTTSGLEQSGLARPLINLGICYYSKGESEKAIEYYQKGLEILLTTKGLENPDVAKLYINLANMNQNKYEEAVNYYQKGLEIFIKIYGEGHPDVANSFTSLGTLYDSKRDFIKSIECHQKALNIILKTSGSEYPDILRAYNNLASSYHSKDDYEKSIETYQKALTANRFINIDFSKANSLEELISSLNGLSQSLLTQHLQRPFALNESYLYIQKAISAIIYQQSTFLDDESSKSFWLSKNYPIYEQAISISLLKAEVDQNDSLRHNTFHYAEKSKASQLQAQIKASDAINFSGIPDSLLQEEHDLRIDITWREKQRQSLLDKGLTETDTNTLRISSIIFDLKTNYEALKLRFETEYPEYYRLKYDLSTVSLQYVQDTLLEPKNQALLEYFVGDSSIYLFVVRPDTMIVQEIKRDFPLEDWIEQFRQGLYGYYTADKGKRDTALYNSTVRQYAGYGQKLYQKLFAPVEKWLPKQVIIVPDGPLGYVPFDALLTSKPEDSLDFKSYPYLLNKYQFSYTYSATLLKEMRDKKHHHEPKKEFAAFAPFYNGDTTLLANMYKYDELMRKDLQPLAYSGPEVAAASKLMRGEIVAGPAATEERFTSTAGDYRILHLATHGRADNRVGDYAFLAFSEIKDSIENELLYVKDLYNLELNADLVVLSACETGIGKLQRGEGIISLARAFAYAGAKSIVTTLWEVNDKSTSELMRYFYRELKLGKSKDEALRLARQRYFDKAAPRGLHPFFWAAFVPVGDMRPVR